MRSSGRLAGLALLVAVLAGCAVGPTATSTVAPRPGRSGGHFETVGPTSPPVVGEVSRALLDVIETDLAARTGAGRASVVVIRAEQLIWPDGSLGCPEPGTLYTQAPVPGFWVVLRAGQEATEYDYRVTAQGRFFLCSRPV